MGNNAGCAGRLRRKESHATKRLPKALNQLAEMARWESMTCSALLYRGLGVRVFEVSVLEKPVDRRHAGARRRSWRQSLFVPILHVEIRRRHRRVMREVGGATGQIRGTRRRSSGRRE